MKSVDDETEYDKVLTMLQCSLEELYGAERKAIIQNTRHEIRTRASADIVLKKIEIRGKEDFYQLRRKWAYYISASLAAMIIFETVITGFLIYWVSIGVLEFKNIHDIFFLIIGENFAQIIGLSYIIARFLFPKE